MTKKNESTPSRRRASPATTERAPRGGLTLERIVDTAVGMIEAQGAGGLSMRQLAAVLEVTPTAIYHHVRDKDALLDLCAQRILSFIPPRDPSLSWQQQLHRLILEQQRVFLRYPGLARFLLVHRETSMASLQWAEPILAVLHGAGLRGAAAIQVLMSLSFLINPLTLLDDKVDKKRSHPMLPKSRAAALLKRHPGQLPHLAEVLPHLGNISYERHFEIALDQVIAGIEHVF